MQTLADDNPMEIPPYFLPNTKVTKHHGTTAVDIISTDEDLC